jgi:hypothetical protein
MFFGFISNKNQDLDYVVLLELQCYVLTMHLSDKIEEEEIDVDC